MKPQILLPFYALSDDDHTATIRAGASIAAHLQGQVDALLIDVEIPRLEHALARFVLDLPGITNNIRAQADVRRTQIREALKNELGGARIPFREKRCAVTADGLVEVIARETRYCDLAVCGLGGNDPAIRTLAEATVFESGRPVILVPARAPAPVLDHVAIAWDGSRVAARAVADARPIVESAKRLTIIAVTDEKPLRREDPAGRLAAYFEQSGRPAAVQHIHIGNSPIAEALQDHARSEGAGLLVMGAFGHSRVRDFVMGGATMGIMEDLRMPVLMSH